MIFPCDKSTPCNTDNPFANLSSEGPEGLLYYGRTSFFYPPALGSDFSAIGCLAICESDVSQEDADLCAARQQVLCVNPNAFYNTEQVCTSQCPDGSLFSYTVPAGVFADTTQQGADEFAFAYACRQAELGKICMLPAWCVACKGEATTIGYGLMQGPEQNYTWFVVSGSIPPGMTFVSAGRNAYMSGTPALAGHYTFTLRCLGDNGNYMQKAFDLYVLEITTTALDPFQVGSAYSFQLQVAGSSGDVAWKIASGALPDGLELSTSGLISGTPTSAASVSVEFEVSDLACEEIDRSFYQPKVEMSTVSQHTVARILGFDPFVATGTNPPKRYKNLAWTGTSEQYGEAWNGGFCGRAKYEWSGASQMNLDGSFATLYVKNLFLSCPDTDVPGGPRWPGIGGSVGSNPPSTFVGYCWPADSHTCDTCPETPVLEGNVAANTTSDGANDFLRPGSGGSVTPTNLSSTGSRLQTVMLEPSHVENFPDSSVNGVTGPWINLRVTDNYSAVLSDEYTDAEALSVAEKWTSNGTVAETRPRTTGYVSEWASVDYTLEFTNLVLGETYYATVTLRADDGTETLVEWTFVADAITHTITGSVPTPASGQTTEVRKPTVAYAP